MCIGHIIGEPVLKPVSYVSVVVLPTSCLCQEKVNKGLVVLLFKQLDTTTSFVYTGNRVGDISLLLPAASVHSEGP